MEDVVVTRDELYLVLAFILYLVSCILYPESYPIQCKRGYFRAYMCNITCGALAKKILAVKLSHFGQSSAVRLTLLSGWITPQQF